MRRLRKNLVAGLVWATSASMLMAATPFVVCHCPNGDIKPFCIVATVTDSPCCCSGTCCGSEGGDSHRSKPKSGAKSCCGHTNASETKGENSKRSSDKSSSGSPVFDKAGCETGLAQVKTSSLNRSETRPTQITLASLELLGEAPARITAPLTATQLTIWALDRLPPPIDLVTSLQRLTI
jgi:hypothetical protein